MQQTGSCPRGPFCAFAHVERELIFSLDKTVMTNVQYLVRICLIYSYFPSPSSLFTILYTVVLDRNEHSWALKKKSNDLIFSHH